jgi:zinc transporter 5/7
MIVSWFDVSDHKGGVLLLIMALLLEIGLNNASKPLINDIGGTKRLQTLSSFVSTILLLPWILFNLLNDNIFTQVSFRH